MTAKHTCDVADTCDKCDANEEARLRRVYDVKRKLTYAHDGPVTAFVILSRAVDQAKTGSAEDVTEALHDALRERGYLVPEDEYLLHANLRNMAEYERPRTGAPVYNTADGE